MLNVSDFEKAKTEIVRKENKIEAAKIEQKDLKKERKEKIFDNNVIDFDNENLDDGLKEILGCDLLKESEKEFGVTNFLDFRAEDFEYSKKIKAAENFSESKINSETELETELETEKEEQTEKEQIDIISKFDEKVREGKIFSNHNFNDSKIYSDVFKSAHKFYQLYEKNLQNQVVDYAKALKECQEKLLKGVAIYSAKNEKIKNNFYEHGFFKFLTEIRNFFSDTFKNETNLKSLVFPLVEDADCGIVFKKDEGGDKLQVGLYIGKPRDFEGVYKSGLTILENNKIFTPFKNDGSKLFNFSVPLTFAPIEKICSENVGSILNRLGIVSFIKPKKIDTIKIKDGASRKEICSSFPEYFIDFGENTVNINLSKLSEEKFLKVRKKLKCKPKEKDSTFLAVKIPTQKILTGFNIEDLNANNSNFLNVNNKYIEKILAQNKTFFLLDSSATQIMLEK